MLESARATDDALWVRRNVSRWAATSADVAASMPWPTTSSW